MTQEKNKKTAATVILGSFGLVLGFFVFLIIKPIVGNAMVCQGIAGNDRDLYARGKQWGGVHSSLTCTPIIAAAGAGDLIFLRDLIKTGINVNMKDSTAYTPLQIAIHWKKNKNVAFLLKKGADICLKGRGGDAATASAIVHDYFYAASILFEIDPDFNRKNNFGESVMDMLKREEKMKELFDKKMEHCKKIKCRRACLLKDTHLKDLKMP